MKECVGNICCRVNKDGTRVCEEVYGEFEQGKNVDDVYDAAGVLIAGLFVIFLFGLDYTKIISFHTIIHYAIAGVLGVYAMKAGFFKKKEANGFFESWKAVDIWLHIYGSLVVYLSLLSIFDFPIEYIAVFVALGVSYGFDILEYIIETRAVSKNSVEKLKWDWDFPNFSQDLIANTIGVAAGYFYVLLFVI